MRFALTITGLVLAFCNPVSAATISAGNLFVAPGDFNFANFPIPISISGGENIANYDLAFSFGDGGAVLGGSDTVPILSVDYMTGTIFNGLTVITGESPSLPSSSATVAGLTTNPPTNRSADGLLATVYVNLTGALPGVYALSVNAGGQSAAIDAAVAPLTLSFQDGSLTIIPEPGTMLLAVAGSLLLLGYSRRRRRN